MKRKWDSLILGAVFLIAVGAVGCGGLGASGSVSPATFLLPGIGFQAPPAPAMPSAADPGGEWGGMTSVGSAVPTAGLPQ